MASKRGSRTVRSSKTATKAAVGAIHPARIESVRVTNYRALRSIHLTELTPLTVLLGPNGSGKSTVFDVFSFLSECFQSGLRQAWDKRGRFKELRSRGATGPVVIEIAYRLSPDEQPTTYHISVDEGVDGPFVAEEWLRWRRVASHEAGAPYKILSFRHGSGWVISGLNPERNDTKVYEKLDDPDVLAASTLGRLSKNERVATLRRLITNWYVSYLSIADTRALPEAGAQEKLSRTGDNLANVVQYLKERHPERLEQIFSTMQARVPRLERVLSEPTADGRLLLRIKDSPFHEPVLARFASDGTLKLLAYLAVLYDPEPPPFIGIEEPENFLHPRLLIELAEECRKASGRSQLLVTTHSPFFLNGMQPREIRILYRDEYGFTQAKRASDIDGIQQFMDHGALLGQLWTEGHFNVGDPLVRGGGPRHVDGTT